MQVLVAGLETSRSDSIFFGFVIDTVEVLVQLLFLSVRDVHSHNHAWAGGVGGGGGGGGGEREGGRGRGKFVPLVWCFM